VAIESEINQSGPTVERRVVTNLHVEGSNFSLSTRDGNFTTAVLATGTAKLSLDTHRLPELAAALLAFHRVATQPEELRTK
jgi:hypothetical protein